VVIGVLLILLGTWFLVRQYIPAIDWDWFWPLILIALGVLVLAMAIKPRANGPE
jgi:Mg2+ and Co2+ transporter CorA